MTKSTETPARRLIPKIILVSAIAAIPLGFAAAPALAAGTQSGTHSASCNFDGNVQWSEFCPD